MKPEFTTTNVQKALRHPRLFFRLLGGFDEAKLAREHIAIHVNKLSKLEMDASGLAPIEAICRAIDICSNSCYHTEYLYLVCKFVNPRKFVETGVHYGASSAFILKALEGTGGKLYSIDLPNVKYQKNSGGVHADYLPSNEETGFVVPSYLRTNWELKLGDSRIELPRLLSSIGKIDVFHHDSMHTYDLMTFEYETVLPALKHGGFLLSDDAHWNNAFKDFCNRYSLENRIYKHVGIAINNS